uniref:Uncharacterized protein n=1 Tax=Glossina austeni TaxID=7395 RepID=A0A1A9UUU0_GLOAU
MATLFDPAITTKICLDLYAKSAILPIKGHYNSNNNNNNININKNNNSKNNDNNNNNYAKIKTANKQKRNQIETIIVCVHWHVYVHKIKSKTITTTTTTRRRTAAAAAALTIYSSKHVLLFYHNYNADVANTQANIHLNVTDLVAYLLKVNGQAIPTKLEREKE